MRLRNMADISIHAPRVGSDPVSRGGRRDNLRISIHAPRVGSDAATAIANMTPTQFQSTLPAWGATLKQSDLA